MVFLTVLKQIIVLFILIFLGVFFSKKNVITEKGVKTLTDIVLYSVTPCVIVKSFIREYDEKALKGILLSFLAATIVHIVFIILANLILHDKSDARKRVLRYGGIFGNCGFMSLPIQAAILGDDGVLYCASFIAIFNFFSWTYGIIEMSGDKKNMSVKKVFINPGVVSLCIGFLIFIFSIPIPKVIYNPIDYMSALNTPIPMLIIGYHLSKSDLKVAIKDFRCFYGCVAKLVILPVVAMAVLHLIGFRGNLFVSTAISALSPTAAYTTIFSYKYGKATDLSVNMISLSTILSLITMPLLITFSQIIS